MRYLLKAVTRVPLPVLYAVGTFIYVVLFHVFRWRREQVASDIARAFPEKGPTSARASCSSRTATSRTS
jgi:hypothetical protein